MNIAGMSLENLLDQLSYAGKRAGVASFVLAGAHDVEIGRAAMRDRDAQEKLIHDVRAELLKRFESTR